jgi:hypothetical protein
MLTHGGSVVTAGLMISWQFSPMRQSLCENCNADGVFGDLVM